MGVLKSIIFPGPRRSVFGHFLWAMAAFVFLVAGADAAQTVYVKVKDAKVRSGASVSSSVVATLQPGAALTVVSVEGPRYKVRTASGAEGYISRLLVSDTKPSSGGGLLAGLGHSDVHANEAETVASIRGLSPAAVTMAQNQGVSKQDVQYAQKMEAESAKVTEAQVESFLKAGDVGL